MYDSTEPRMSGIFIEFNYRRVFGNDQQIATTYRPFMHDLKTGYRLLKKDETEVFNQLDNLVGGGSVII
ncbi:hypothetical protein HZB02_01805 [Candidatus Woesearchaeota archaeon]|nr:hypothetical protein [Candidatus Woesearchaeota archaeon]